MAASLSSAAEEDNPASQALHFPRSRIQYSPHLVGYPIVRRRSLITLADMQLVEILVVPPLTGLAPSVHTSCISILKAHDVWPLPTVLRAHTGTKRSLVQR